MSATRDVKFKGVLKETIYPQLSQIGSLRGRYATGIHQILSGRKFKMAAISLKANFLPSKKQ
jgi:hypothetical protein